MAGKAGKRPLVEREPELIDKVAAALQAGHYANTACAMVGMSETAYYATLQKGDAALRRQRDGEELTERDALYARFAEAVHRGSSNAEERALKVIRDAMADEWQAAGWFLERRYPRKWGRFDRVETTERPADPVAEAAMRDEKVAELVDDLIASISSGGESCGAGEAE